MITPNGRGYHSPGWCVRGGRRRGSFYRAEQRLAAGSGAGRKVTSHLREIRFGVTIVIGRNRAVRSAAGFPAELVTRDRRRDALPGAVIEPGNQVLRGVQNRLPEVVDRLQREHGCVVITRHGHPAAMVISADDLKKLDVMDSAAAIIV